MLARHGLQYRGHEEALLALLGEEENQPVPGGGSGRSLKEAYVNRLQHTVHGCMVAENTIRTCGVKQILPKKGQNLTVY